MIRVKKFLYIVVKEFLQIIRDLPGLAILFLMPAVMLIVITLTQAKVMIGMESGMRIVVVNKDSAALGDSIVKAILSDKGFTGSASLSATEAEKSVFDGRYQLMISIPRGATAALYDLARKGGGDTTLAGPPKIPDSCRISILFDPAIMKIYREVAGNSLRMIVGAAAMKIYAREFTGALRKTITEQLNRDRKKFVVPGFEKNIPEFPGRQGVIQQIRDNMERYAGTPVSLELPVGIRGAGDLAILDEKVAGHGESILQDNLVRNNVPGFILFAMFFIVIPLAGSVLGEKQLGTRDRLMTLPVNRMTLLSGKIAVYLGVCILQFLFMTGIGIYIFPVISQLPALSLRVNLPALVGVILASGLAAVGFGLLIGTFSNSFLQAAPLGSVLVVVLAILGGVFVPAYMMPDAIRGVSMISPMRWGTDAFFSVFSRGSGLTAVLPQILSLLTFFTISLVLSIAAYGRQK